MDIDSSNHYAESFSSRDRWHIFQCAISQLPFQGQCQGHPPELMCRQTTSSAGLRGLVGPNNATTRLSSFCWTTSSVVTRRKTLIHWIFHLPGSRCEAKLWLVWQLMSHIDASCCTYSWEPPSLVPQHWHTTWTSVGHGAYSFPLGVIRKCLALRSRHQPHQLVLDSHAL